MNFSEHRNKLNLFIAIIFILTGTSIANAQCTPLGDEVTYGSGSWIGYVYDGANNFASADYQGFTTESANFNQTFCGSTCDFTTNGCDVTTTTFSVRYKMNQSYVCGEYTLTIGGDDGVRLSLDGGATWLLDDYSNHGYRTTSTTLLLDGTYNMVFEFYENTGGNRVSFSSTSSGSPSTGGEIDGDRSLCAASYNPPTFNNLVDGGICGTAGTYQWYSSPDGSTWSSISGATSATYNSPALSSSTYFIREISGGGDADTSNIIFLEFFVPLGDEVTYGAGSWIGYVYDGSDNFLTSDYKGYVTESEMFDQSFCGNACNFSTNGCNVVSETFSVRYKMTQTYVCGEYTLTVGADNGVRLSIDGGATWLIDDYVAHSYRTESATILLDGTYNLVIEYYENGSSNRISFTSALTGSTSAGGTIDGDNNVCGSSYDPPIFNSIIDGAICGSATTYQWFSSADGITWSSIAGANSSNYDSPSISDTTYFFREISGGGDADSSNVILIELTPTLGDEVTYGAGFWIGYFYDGSNNFATTDYKGYTTETENFDQSFCGSTCDYSTNGCDIYTETFSARYQMTQTYACAEYVLTLGSDNGARLSIDGGLTWLIDDYSAHTYRTMSETLVLDGTYNLMIEYFDDAAANRVSFSIVATGATYSGGTIDGADVVCAITYDPPVFNSIIDGAVCGSATSYQWYSSADGITWSSISGATSSTYNSPSISASTYFFREISGGASLDSSNTIFLELIAPLGDQTTYGAGSWIGYVYDGVDNFASIDYIGYVTETENFNEMFCGNDCDYSTNGCDVRTESFSVRYKMTQTYSCAEYTLTLGGDDGVRLSIDGGATWLIDDYSVHPYRTSSIDVILDGTYNLVIEYYESGSNNQVSFTSSATGFTSSGGTISGDDVFCGTTYDPPVFSSVDDGLVCGTAVTYQWHSSPDASTWSSISGATSSTYNSPSLSSSTYFIREILGGGIADSSNVIFVELTVPLGDETTYGAGSWIGYVYEEQDDYTTANYVGYITETDNFNETFCGSDCNFATNGCYTFTSSMSVRFKMQKTFACAEYELTIGGDDGVRLSIDGGATWIIDDYTGHGYRTTSTSLVLDGSYDMVLEYFEGGGGNRVSYSSSATGFTSSGGTIDGDDVVCGTSYDPPVFNNVADGIICATASTYQWFSSADAITWSSISGATSSSYDSPALATSTYFFRQISGGGVLDTSNIIFLEFNVPLGDEVTYGVGSWIGYVYDGQNNYASGDYLGYITETENYNETFCGSNCTFPTNGCSFFTGTFSIRFKMRQTYACGEYVLTMGGDDGVRLSIDGGATWLIDDYTGHGYRTTSATVVLDGSYDLVLEYFEGGGGNRVSFSSSATGLTSGGGTIDGDNSICGTSYDPPVFNNIVDGQICATATTYQWFSSPDGTTWSSISGATSGTYDSPSLASDTYFFRQILGGGSFDSSNIIFVDLSTPLGDEVTYGAGTWIGYVYDGRDNYSAVDYIGYLTETENFNETFCGNNCTFSTNGCSTYAGDFSIRFKMQQTYACGEYTLIMGGDDGVRLSIDGGSTWLIDDYSGHGYRTTSATVVLSGTYDLVLEYYEGGGGNRVSFSSSVTSFTPTGGTINGDDEVCALSYDPPVFASVVDGKLCATTPAYQWYSSSDGTTWSSISGATAVTYDPPSRSTSSYFFREVSGGGDVDSSNVIFLEMNPPSGDEVSYGTNSWIGYAYEGADEYGTTSYLGFATEGQTFDQSFCGVSCNYSLTGCDLYTQAFTIRYKMALTLTAGDYFFEVGGNDGFRLSLDGGSTYFIDEYYDHGYITADSTVTLASGTYNMVLEYYEVTGSNRVKFDYSAVLAVSWVSFTSTIINDEIVKLNWSTATETNSDNFIVQRSANGNIWENIGLLTAAGESSELQSYEFIDDSPFADISYYRIKQVDFDGSFSYSEIEVVSLNKQEVKPEIYPSPASDFITLKGIDFDSDNPQIFTLSGQNITEMVEFNKDGDNINLGISKLPVGSYFLKTPKAKLRFIKY